MDVEEVLAHHGIRGMKWGVRKQEASGSGRTSSGFGKPTIKPKLSPLEHQVLNQANKEGMTNDRMKAMFGPEPPKQKRINLTDNQKKALKDIGETAFIVGGVYVLSKYGEHSALMGPVKGQGETLVNFWKDYAKSSAKTEFSAKEVANFSTSRVHLSAGSIVKRISTESETEIRPGGFFAAYKDEDVNRYKAVLPVYWKMWGIDKGTGGHVMSLKAKEAIKAPSEKETFEMFKEVLEKADPAGGKYRDMYDPNYIRTMLGKKPKAEMPTEELARKLLRSASANWNNNDEPLSKAFFEHVRSNGFNALIDMNDAGHLSSQPLRLLDGSMFDIAGSERLTPALIKTAQETLVKVAHAFNTMVKTFLAHGVKPDFVFRY